MDGVGKSLDPDFDFVSSAAPWIYEIKGATKYLKEEAIKWWERNVVNSINKIIDGSTGTTSISKTKNASSDGYNNRGISVPRNATML